VGLTTELRSASAAPAAEAEALRRALTAAPLPSLPSRYFYDERGSRLFEAITRLPEYYLTRAEHALLASVAGELARRAPSAELVELGSGASAKVRLLMDALAAAGRLKRCVLLDISGEALRQSVAALAAAYRGVAVRGLVGDFVEDLDAIGPGGDRLIAFLGSTIGNLDPAREVPAFFARVARQLAPGDAFLLGVDLVKDRRTLEAAYNDAAGVTAEFNRNILRVVNRRFDADFDPDDFEHVAFYDEARSWIEMRLRARRDVRARVRAAGLVVSLRRGEEIRTEISCKYTRRRLGTLARGSGLKVEEWFTGSAPAFGLALMRPARRRRPPAPRSRDPRPTRSRPAPSGASPSGGPGPRAARR
jgi:L-histidine N-alpha-methyltransferase